MEIAVEHEELLAVLRTRDPARVREALREHIATTQIALLDQAADERA